MTIKVYSEKLGPVGGNLGQLFLKRRGCFLADWLILRASIAKWFHGFYIPINDGLYFSLCVKNNIHLPYTDQNVWTFEKHCSIVHVESRNDLRRLAPRACVSHQRRNTKKKPANNEISKNLIISVTRYYIYENAEAGASNNEFKLV